LGKKIKDAERPAEFSRIRDLIFKETKVNYDSSNLVHYETYRRALRRFGLVNDMMAFTYPDSISKYDLRTEEGITELMRDVSKEYTEIKNDIDSDPVSMRDTLWPLFRTDYNPKFEAFADGELAEIEMTLAQIDKIIKTEGLEKKVSDEAAKGTSLEGTFGNPFDLAESIRNSINIRYIQSFGYKIEGISESIGKQDLFDLVQRNLGKGAPFKLSEEEQTARDLAELKERAAASKESPLNQPETQKTEEKAASSINTAEEKKEVAKTEASAINPAEVGSEVKSETSATAPTTSSTPSEVATEVPPPSTAGGENILNVQMEPTPVNVTAPSSKSTVINQATTASPAKTESVTSTSKSETVLKTESEKSAVNEVKEKKGGFSKFLEKITDSKIGQSLNLSGLAETAKDFAKVTKSQVLGSIPSLEKIKSSPSGINQFKESLKESATAISESSKTESAMNSVDKLKEIFSNKEKEAILEKSPQTLTETQKTEVIEKTAPSVTPLPAANLLNTTQNASTQTSTASTVNQSTQEGGSTSQTIQNTNQSTVSQPAPSSTEAGASPAGGASTGMSTSEMERTLKNIEFHLLNGIEVTVKQSY
jgi:hypothetical protein